MKIMPQYIHIQMQQNNRESCQWRGPRMLFSAWDLKFEVTLSSCQKSAFLGNLVCKLQSINQSRNF